MPGNDPWAEINLDRYIPTFREYVDFAGTRTIQLQDNHVKVGTALKLSATMKHILARRRVTMKLVDYRSSMSWQVVTNPKKPGELNEWHDMEIARLIESGNIQCGQCGRIMEVTEDTKLYIGSEYDGSRSIYMMAIPVCNHCSTTNNYYARSLTCSVCGLLHATPYKFVKPNTEREEIVCPSCLLFKEDISRCANCGTHGYNDTYKEAINRTTGKRNLLCPRCFSSGKVCPKCNSYKGIERYKYYAIVKGKTVQEDSCSHCIGKLNKTLLRCGMCSKIWTSENITIPNRKIGIHACPNCIKAIKPVCSICGKENGTKHNLCMACQTGHIKEWDYKPPEFLFYGNANISYGIELEISGFPHPRKRDKQPTGKKLQCALELHSISREENDFYLVKDSTTDGGFEIVFHPRSYESWTSDGMLLLKRVTTIARKYGAVSYKGGSCGIHIHRSIKDISTTSRIATLLYCVQSIEPYAFIVAQRTGVTNKICCETNTLTVGAYGSFARMKQYFPDNGVGMYTAKQLLLLKDTWIKGIASDHHAAITFGVGKETIELRIFRGTLIVDTILAYLSFYHLLAEWSKVASLNKLMESNHATNWSSFGRFLESRTDEATFRLKEYVKGKGVIL